MEEYETDVPSVLEAKQNVAIEAQEKKEEQIAEQIAEQKVEQKVEQIEHEFHKPNSFHDQVDHSETFQTNPQDTAGAVITNPIEISSRVCFIFIFFFRNLNFHYL